MQEIIISDLVKFYEHELLDNIVPFWVKYAPDVEAGGYHTCLNRDGSVYDYDKLCMWGQGRLAWILAHLYNEIDKRPDWLATSRMGIEFITRYAFDPEGRMYYAMTRDGRPLENHHCIFTELSTVLAFSEYARATGDAMLHRRARELFDLCWNYILDTDNRERNLGLDPQTLKVRRHAHAMIVLNVLQQLRLFREDPQDAQRIDTCLKFMLNDHQKIARKLVLEVVGWEDGSPAPGWMGRWVNPGHMIEGGIFIVHEAWYRRNADLKKTGLNWIRWGFELGWDPIYGGLFNDVDVEGLPIPGAAARLADSKLWWQHAEALYGLLLAYLESSDSWFWEAYKKTHDYSFTHFADPEYGEWYAYLDRTGRPINRVKGSDRKNLFHIGRNFLWITQLLRNRLPRTGLIKELERSGNKVI